MVDPNRAGLHMKFSPGDEKSMRSEYYHGGSLESSPTNGPRKWSSELSVRSEALARVHENNNSDEEADNEEVYCICRSSDTSRFMIGCDNCNEWYHGDCISITEEYAKKILQFYCLICRDKDSSLQIKFKEKKSNVKKAEKQSLPFAEHCDNSQDRDLGLQTLSRSTEIPEFEDYIEEEEDLDDDDEFEFSAKGTKRKKLGKLRGRPPNKDKRLKRNEPKQKKSQGGRKASGKKRKPDERPKRVHKRSNKDPIEVDEGPKQCYGPGCVKVARRNSKYCSDECGVKLATNRIYEILPHRISQWQSTSSVADEFSQKSLDSIRVQQLEAKHVLEELDRKLKELDDLMMKSQLISVASEDEYDEAEGDTELSVYCVTCGHEVSQRLAMRHMERCFNKFESQTCFGSAFKTKVEGVFCDVFNPHSKTFCKRLKVLCPEHSKDPKITDDEICGCPLVNERLEYSGSFCRVLKKKCTKHHCWAKLLRAELDMQRLQQWFKLDDLFEREQKIRFTMANRGGVLALMLHQTIK